MLYASNNLRLKVYQTDKVSLVASTVLIQSKRNGRAYSLNFRGPDNYPAAEADLKEQVLWKTALANLKRSGRSGLTNLSPFRSGAEVNSLLGLGEMKQILVSGAWGVHRPLSKFRGLMNRLPLTSVDPRSPFQHKTYPHVSLNLGFLS